MIEKMKSACGACAGALKQGFGRIVSFFKGRKKKYESMTNQELSVRKFILSLILMLALGCFVGAVAQRIFRHFYGELLGSLSDWANMLLPLFIIILFFLVYVLAFAAYASGAFLEKALFMRRSEDSGPWQTCFMWGIVAIIGVSVLGFFGILPF